MAEQMTTFWGFINSRRIEIPIIQRDYAQGRLGKEYLRKTFLANIKRALDGELPNGEKKLKLDFVYGSILKGSNSLQPLDGQQRLTTMWLLHWYIALRAGKLDEDVCDVLRKFSYETRISSREFCENLCVPKHFAAFDGNDVVGFIRKSTWFYSAWEQDPTIQSMLRMLEGTKINDKNGRDITDGLEELFAGKEECDFKGYWDDLTSRDAPIVFYYQPLEDFGLSDDLYIKMNARGKQLTNFENLKATIIGNMRQEQPQSKDEEKREWDELSDVREGIPIKMDTKWTDMLWRYALNRWEELSAEEKKGDCYPMVDDYFMNLLSYVHQTLFFFSNGDAQTGDFDDTFASQEKFYAVKENLTFLSNFLDVWYMISEEYKGENGIDTFFNKLLGENGVTLWNSNAYSNLFVECIKSGLKMDVRLQILFYAISKYCMSKECYTVTPELKMVVRICRNLIESVYQFDYGRVVCTTNIRLTEWSRYRSAIDGIVNNIVEGEAWFKGIEGKDFRDVEHERNKYENGWDDRGFIERWEDHEIFKGCLKAVLPALRDNSIEDVDKAITAFIDAEEEERVQILIAFGYCGEVLGACDNYNRQKYFFGKDGKWDVIFRRSFDRGDERMENEKKVEVAFSKFVSEYKGCPNVKELIARELQRSEWNSFKYYMLKGSKFVRGSEGTHYLAVKGGLDELDMINIKFSPNPLLGYHCDPFAFVVCQNVNPEPASYFQQLRCVAGGINNRSSVYIQYSPDDKGECFAELHSCKEGWIIRKKDEKNRGYLQSLYVELGEKGVEMEDCGEGEKLIRVEKDKGDLIELGERVAKICLDWINKTNFDDKLE